MSKIGTNHKSKHLANLAYAGGLVSLVLAIALSLTGGVSQSAGLAAIAPGLGSAGSFAVLGGSTVTNTGSSVVNGNLGVFPGSAITGFPPGIVNGTIYAGDAVAQQAQDDVTTAYNALGSQACDHDLTGQDLGGLTLTQGVYCYSTSAQLTGTLTLDAQGNSLAVWVFQIGSTLTTASDASVQMINGYGACNVFWQVGTSATLGTGTEFAGNILAMASITLNTNTNVLGRTLARSGAVTLDTNNITIAVCSQAPTDVPPTDIPPTVVPTTAVPPTATLPAPHPTWTTIPATETLRAPLATNTPAPTATAKAAINTNTPAPTVTASATPAVLIPATGVDLAGMRALASRQWIRIGLGFLGLSLVLLGFFLRRSPKEL
jgi:hypothetical protein